VRRARRTLIWLGVIIAAIALLNGLGAAFWGGSWLPKLALDLEGGTQIILAPRVNNGQTVSSEQLNQAVAIMRQRVDASGVAEAEITTEGGQNIVVSLPGTPDADTIQRIEASASLKFRPVLYQDAASPDQIGGATTSPTPAPSPSVDVDPTVTPTGAGDPAWITDGLMQQFQAFSCNTDIVDPPDDKPLITCSTDGTGKYILGPVELNGDVITDAQAGVQTTQQGASTGVWQVQITMNEQGAQTFGQISQRLYGAQPPLNEFAFVLDNKVLSAPSMNALILDGRPSISGNFTQESAKTLADQLKFGALPISFVVQSQDNISATLGTTQLAAGLVAGLIGLILVVIYSFFQYRTLGFVTIASLAIAAGITYLVVDFLSWREGYRLSLAGIAGLIVAIGITADSFIVYFERIRDELRDGRGLESAVEAGWRRARRTILASDAVNLLAAAVLYVLAVGSVRGFALTLGITTIIDVFLVFLFTHPVMQLLARLRFFADGHPASGLDPRKLGAVYRGRAQFRTVAQPGKASARSSREAARRQTIAERKAAQATGTGDDVKDKDGATR